MAREFLGLEPLLGFDLRTTVVYSDLEKMVVCHAPETDRIELKRGLPKQEELARDVAALANNLGGLMFIGVDERGTDGAKTDSAQKLVPISKHVGQEPVADWVTKVLAQQIVPRLTIGTAWVDDPSNPNDGFLIIGVPRGDQAPYAVDMKDGKFAYVRRRGSHKGPLTEAEIAVAYGGRGKSRQGRQQRFDELVRQTPRTRPLNNSIGVRIIAVPETPGEFQMGPNTVTDTTDWLIARGQPLIDPEPCERKVILRGVSIQNLPLTRFESHADGSAVIEFLLRAEIAEAPGSAPHHVATDQQLLFGFADGLQLAARHAQERGNTFGLALSSGAISHSGTIDLRQHAQKPSLDGFGPKVGVLPNGGFGFSSVINLDEVASSHRSACHAVWLSLNEFYQSAYALAVCELMNYDGRFNLAQLSSEAATVLSERPIDPDSYELIDINDEVYGIVTRIFRRKDGGQLTCGDQKDVMIRARSDLASHRHDQTPR
jgi:Putative DNA-binding domain